MFDTLKALGDQLLAQTAPTPPSVMQAIFSLLALFVGLSALMVGVTRNLFHSLLCLVATLFGVAAIYFMLEAEFVGVSQILVYVGAISTLITFAVMLTKGMMFGGTSPVNRQSLIAVIISGLLFVTLTGVLTNIPWPAGNEIVPNDASLIAGLGESFVTTYLIAFELMAMLLLVALAGAILLARDRKPKA